MNTAPFKVLSRFTTLQKTSSETSPDSGDMEDPDIVTREDGSMLVDGDLIDELRETISLKEFDFEDADYYACRVYSV